MARGDASRWLSPAIVLAAFAGGVFVLLGQPGLPAQFTYDSDLIQRLATNENFTVADPSYERIADFYGSMGLGADERLAGVVTFVAYAAVVFLVVLGAGPRSIATAFLAGISLVLGCVYLGQFTKDFVPVLLVGLALSPLADRRRRFLLAVGIILYAVLFRQYWAIVLVGGILFAFVLARYRLRTVVAVAFALWLVIAVAFSVRLGVPLGHFRKAVNAERTLGLDASTLISGYIDSPSILGGVVDTGFVAFTLIVPFPLLALGTAYHASIALIIFGVWAGVGTSLRRLIPLSGKSLDAAALLIAFVSTQAIFEPDFGSYLRHLTPLLPLALYLSRCADQQHTRTADP